MIGSIINEPLRMPNPTGFVKISTIRCFMMKDFVLCSSLVCLGDVDILV